MKHLLLITLVTTSFSGLAYAENGIYASLKSGISNTKMKNNEVHYFYDDGEYFSYEDYYQHNQSKSIYPHISAAIGFDFSKISKVNTRAELEYTYKDNATFTPSANYEVWSNNFGSEIYPGAKDLNLFSHDLKSQSLMVNGYYDFKNKSKFTPYIGVGLGVTRIKNNYVNLLYPDYYLSQNDNHFTWSTGIGVTYNINNNVALDLSYKYVDMGKFTFGQNFKEHDAEMTSFKLSSQDYSLGIRYNF